MGRARHHGLSVCDWFEPVDDAGGVVRALSESRGAAVVNLCRFLPETVIPEIDLAATAVLANSGHEPFGLVGLEAMAAGTPVVTSDVGGLTEIIRHGENGLLVDNTPAAIAAALRLLLDNPAFARSLGEAARRTVMERFTVDHMVRRTMEVYRQVLS